MTTTYPAAKTALVLIDLLNDFMAAEGKLHGAIGPMIDKLGLEASLARLIDGARQAGVRIVYAPHGMDAHSFDDLHHVLPRFLWAQENQVMWKGTWGDEFFAPLAPHAGDVVCRHHRMFNSFMGTDLEEQLKGAGIEMVVLAGFTSQTCVEGTGRHALEAGYHVTFIKDAVGEFTEEAHRAALDISYPTFGHEVLTVDQFLEHLQLA